MPRSKKQKVAPNSKYTPERVEKIVNAIAVGATFTHACNYAGIDLDTFANWRRRYSEFSEAIKEAEGRAVIGWLARIEAAAKEGAWQAAAWKLERRYPQDFARRDRMPIDVTELDAEIERTLAGMAPGGESPVSGPAESEAIN